MTTCKISYRDVAIAGIAVTFVPRRHLQRLRTIIGRCVRHGSFNPAFTTLSHANEKTVYTGYPNEPIFYLKY